MKARAVVLSQDVMNDTRLLAASPVAQVLFVRLLGFLDTAGELGGCGVLPLQRHVALLLRLHENDAQDAVDELAGLRLIMVRDGCLSVPDFPHWQHEGWREHQGLSAPTPVAGARADIPAVVHPARPTARHPLIPGESPQERKRRLKNERNARYYHGKARPAARSLGLPTSESTEAATESSARSPADEGPSSVRLASDVRPSDASRPRLLNSEVPRSESEEKKKRISLHHPLLKSGERTREASEGRMSDVSPGRPSDGAPSDVDDDTVTGRPESATRYGDSTTASRAEEILQILSDSSEGLFRFHDMPLQRRELALQDARLESLPWGQYPKERWAILGAYIAAGGFNGLRDARFERKHRGRIIKVPDLPFFVRRLTQPLEGAPELHKFDLTPLIRSLHEAMDWEEAGRPPPDQWRADGLRG